MNTNAFQLGGIVKPNDGACHLDKNGMYTYSSLQDYPSISQVTSALGFIIDKFLKKDKVHVKNEFLPCCKSGVQTPQTCYHTHFVIFCMINFYLGVREMILILIFFLFQIILIIINVLTIFIYIY